MRKSDFETIKENGQFKSFTNFSISYLDRKLNEKARIGIIISKKISSNAVMRNRVKRLIREILRKNSECVKSGFDYVILAKSGIIHQSFAKLDIELTEALKTIL